MSGTKANFLGLRKSIDLEHSIDAFRRAEREKKHPHEHNWAKNYPRAHIAIALVSGWVGQGRVAVRFVGQKDNVWHLYTYPYPHKYLGIREDPCLPSKTDSSSASDSTSSNAQDSSNSQQEQTNTT